VNAAGCRHSITAMNHVATKSFSKIVKLTCEPQPVTVGRS
jgi:hypothetical protein